MFFIVLITLFTWSLRTYYVDVYTCHLQGCIVSNNVNN